MGRIWRKGRNPYANMVKGTLRCLIEECSHLVSQILNIEDEISDTATFICNAVLRLQLFHAMRHPENILWSHEPEIHLRDGMPFISRYLPNKELDLGYNSLQRDVSVEVLPLQQVTRLVSDGPSLSLERLRMSSLLPTGSLESHSVTEIIVRFSLPTSLYILKIGYVYLMTGLNNETGQIVLMSSCDHQSRLSIHKDSLVPLPSLSERQEQQVLKNIQNHFHTEVLIGRCPPFSSVIVHEAPRALAESLLRSAGNINVQMIFTTCDACVSQNYGWKLLHRRGSFDQLKDLMQSDTLLCIDCTQSRTTQNLEKMGFTIPPGLQVVSSAEFTRRQSFMHSNVEIKTVRQILEAAVCASPSAAQEYTGTLVSIQKLPQTIELGPFEGLISWIDKLPVRATVLPALEDVHFSSDKTYFLVGMTGSLGLSTVSYMITRGARHFALSSHNPKVDSEWIQNQKALYGANINIFKL